jgi:hypothetical protein
MKEREKEQELAKDASVIVCGDSMQCSKSI